LKKRASKRDIILQAAHSSSRKRKMGVSLFVTFSGIYDQPSWAAVKTLKLG
jgi:hypothetical protein